MAVRDGSATTLEGKCSEGVQAVIFTCNELWVSRCLSVCDEPLHGAHAKPETGLETVQSVSAIDDTSGEEELGDHPRSSTLFNTHQSLTSTRESRPLKKKRLNKSSPARTRDATHFGGCTKLRLPCLRSCQTSRVARQSSTIEVQPPFKSIAMDVKTCLGGQREKGCKLCMWSVKGALCTLWFPFETMTRKRPRLEG